MLDNECSRAVKEYIISEDTDLQFVESYNHRVNAAKHDYKATKYHAIAMMCTINPTCPIPLWDQFVPQIDTTLNIMRTSQINSTKSAYKALNR